MNNYFQLLGLPQDFFIDQKQLQQNYLIQQGLTHPDRFVNANAQEQRIAVQRNALVNEAYNTLKDPIKRAVYMQSLCSDINIEQHTHRDIEFLQKQITLREDIENAETNLEANKQIINEIKQSINICLEQFAKAYNDEDFDASQLQLDRAMFYAKCLKDINLKTQVTTI